MFAKLHAFLRDRRIKKEAIRRFKQCAKWEQEQIEANAKDEQLFYGDQWPPQPKKGTKI